MRSIEHHLVQLEPGAEEAVFSSTESKIKKTIHRCVGRDLVVTKIKLTGRERHGSSYAKLEFIANIHVSYEEHSMETQVKGWYGLSINAESDRISVYETIDW